jgi:hypothetical protein
MIFLSSDGGLWVDNPFVGQLNNYPDQALMEW